MSFRWSSFFSSIDQNDNFNFSVIFDSRPEFLLLSVFFRGLRSREASAVSIINETFKNRKFWRHRNCFETSRQNPSSKFLVSKFPNTGDQSHNLRVSHVLFVLGLLRTMAMAIKNQRNYRIKIVPSRHWLISPCRDIIWDILSKNRWSEFY